MGRMTQQSPTTTIAPGVEMPLVGLGTWQASGDDARRAVVDALEVGYRLIDTATGYGNEDQVGQALRDAGLPREDVFVTTKLPPEQADDPRGTLETSLAALGVDALDLWLVHWPPGGEARPDVWEQLVAAREEGLTRAIGVSNYSPAQIDELVDATGVTPAVNQVKWGPSLWDAGVVAAHAERGVVLEGYSPFKVTDMSAEALTAAAEAHGKTPEQVVLRWHLQHGVVSIPKSTNRERIAANFAVFDVELTDEEMAAIDGLGQG